MSFRSFSRFVAATDAAAMVCRISGLSFSRLNGFILDRFSFLELDEPNVEDRLLFVLVFFGEVSEIAGPAPTDTEAE